MKILKYATAATIKFGPFLDETDGKTAESALTIQKADVRLSKNGGNMAAASADQGTSDAGAPYDEIGYYDISLNTTDTGTLGNLKIMVHESGALPVWDDWTVVPANVYESLVANTEFLEVTSLKPDWSIASTTLTLKKRDDSTTQFTKELTTGTADPITGMS